MIRTGRWWCQPGHRIGCASWGRSGEAAVAVPVALELAADGAVLRVLAGVVAAVRPALRRLPAPLRCLAVPLRLGARRRQARQSPVARAAVVAAATQHRPQSAH